MRSCFFVPGKELKMADTLLRFKPEMAEKFGVNAAIVAQLIWEKKRKRAEKGMCISKNSEFGSDVHSF